MTGKDRFLVDSSLWVDLERGRDPVQSKLSELVRKNVVCLADIIVAELLRGARTDVDFRGLKLRLEAFPIYQVAWRDVGALGYAVRRAGYSPPLADLYIAQCAVQFRKTVLTRDHHFREIASVRKFKVEVW